MMIMFSDVRYSDIYYKLLSISNTCTVIVPFLNFGFVRISFVDVYCSVIIICFNNCINCVVVSKGGVVGE